MCELIKARLVLFKKKDGSTSLKKVFQAVDIPWTKAGLSRLPVIPGGPSFGAV